MKKVLKKFNRTLSIMLAAAMVLTTVPQAALTVSAAEPELEAQLLDEQDPVSDGEIIDEEVSEGSEEPGEPADSEESETPEEPAAPESPETPEEQVTPENPETPEEQVTPENPETPEEQVTPENPEMPEAPEVPEESDESHVTLDSGIMSVTPSDAVISFDSKSGGEADTADIAWVGGCVDSNKKLATNKDLRFRIKLHNGRKLTKVVAKIGEAGEGKTQTEKNLTDGSADADTIYTVAWSDIKKTVEGKDVGQPVQIVVTTEAQTYTITFAGTNAKIYAVAPVDAEDTSKGDMKGAEVTAAVTNAAYDTAVTYVVEANDGYKLSDVKVGDLPVTVGKTDLKASASATETTKYDTISIKPSDYKKAWDNDAFTVTVNAVAKATLTANIAANVNVELSDGATDTDVIPYDKTNGNFGNAITEGALKDTSKLSFGVKAKANYKITGVTAVAKTAAEAAAGAEGTEIPAADIVAGTAADGVVPYTVSLKNVKDFKEDTTVTITVATTYADAYAVTNVHTVTFEGDLDKAVVTTGAGKADLPEGNIVEVETTDDDKNLQINVAPEEGYALPKRGGSDEATKEDLVISVTKQVRYETETEGTYGTAQTQTEQLKVDGGYATLILAGADNNYTGGDAADAQPKKFTVASATVTIKTVIEENDDDKQLFVDNKLGEEDAKCPVQYAEKGGDFKDAELDETLNEDNSNDTAMDNTWYIPKAAERVKVTVDTGKTPKVSLDGAVLTEEEGTEYDYIIPAVNLKTADAGGSTLTIEAEAQGPEKQADVNVKVNVKDVALTCYEVNGEEKIESLEDGAADESGYYTLTNQAVVGKSLSLTFEQVEGATLKSVSYTMGEDAAKEVAVKKGAAVLEIEEVTGEVTVDVVSESAYIVKLYDSNDEELEKDKDGVYEADYTATGITIKLYKTENQKDDVDFYDVVVEDGAATAETGADIDVDGRYATLGSIHKSERGKTLTIKVYKKGQDEPFTAKLRTNANSSSVKVTRVVGGKTAEVKKDDTVTMPLDARMTFKVESVGASVSDLGVKLFKDNKALTATEQAWFADNGVVTLEEDGTFTIATTPSKEKRGEVEVRIFNANEEVEAGQTEKALDGAGSFKLNVDGYMVKNDVTGVTATPGVTSNKTVRINLNATFKDKKNLPADPRTGDLYYKVVLDEITVADPQKPLPANVVALTGGELTKYYRLPADNYANPARTIAIDLVKDTRTGDAADEDIQSILSTNIKEVSLVQSVVGDDLETKTNVAETDYVSGHTATIKDKDKLLTTKAPLYETKLSVKTVNGAAVFTGQEDVKVATPVFGKDTGYDELTVQFVDTKTGVLYGDPGTGEDDKAEYGNFEAWVDAKDNSIYVSATSGYDTASYYKTLGVKVSANYPQTAIGDGYAATAVVKLNIKQGIYRIEADESKAKLPDTIFVVPGSKGKNGSAKITPKYNYGSKTAKPAKAAVTWAINFDEQNANIQKNLNAVNAKGKAAPTISVKNGTVTVTKDYQFGKTAEENTFTVTAKAADFAGNEEQTYTDFTFTITDEQNVLEDGSIVIVDGNGEVQNASALKAEDFDVALYVAALKNDVKKGQDFYSNDDFMPVTITSGSKANLEVVPVSYNRAKITFKKPGTKLKINVNTVDGGKASRGVKVKDTLLVNVAAYENLGLCLTGADGSWYTPDTEGTIKYDGGSNQMYTLYLQHWHTVGRDADSWQYDSLYKNVKVTIKGGKIIANKEWAKDSDVSKMGTAVVVNSKDGKATITVTDTANPDKAKNHKDYTIENTSFKGASQKAPSIKLVSPKKITNDALYNEDDGYWNPIVYQVTDKNIDYTGQYVKVTPDYTVANNMAEELTDGYGTIAVAKIDENGRFELYPDQELESGSYKMIATVCEMKRGEILPLAKDVKLSFSIPKEKKLNTSLSVTAKYTLDAKSSSKADIAVKTDSRLRYVISEAKNVIKSAKDQGVTKDAHTNEFTKYFEVKEARTDYAGRPISYTIGLKNTLSAAEIAYITGTGNTDDKELQKKAKEDCTGYITVSNGYYSRGEFQAYNTKDIKVTISFKENKYSVTGASVFAPKDNVPVTVNVTLMNGKKPVSVVAAALVGEQTFAESAKAVSLNGGRSGVIAITSQKTAEAKKHDVKLKVVPADSGFIKTATWNNTAGKWDLTYVNKEGTTTYASEAELIEACGVEVTAKIDVKAVDARKVFKAGSLNVALSADNYVPSATAGKMGDYVAYVPYEFVAGNTDISAVALAKDKDNKDLNEIAGKVDGKDLITVAAKDANSTIYDDDGRPCIRISVNKAALKDQYEKTEANKKAAANAKVPVVTTYGAKLKVPVVFTYTNNGSTTETVTFTVTMPKKAMTFSEVKDVLDGTTKIGAGKNARDLKAEIEKMTTPQEDQSDVILKGLLVKVWNKVNDTIPRDADVALTPDWSELDRWDGTLITKAELNDGEPVDNVNISEEADYDAIMTAGKAKVTLTITDKLGTGDAAKAPVSYNFNDKALGVKHRVDSNGFEIETAIQDAIQDYLDELTATNDLTEETLLAEIWKLDGVKEYNSDRDSVNIWIQTWERVEATERKAGSLVVTVCVNDDNYSASARKTIARINNIGDVKDQLDEELTAANVKQIVDDCSGIEEKIHAKILADAKAAIANNSLEVTYAQRDKADSDTAEKEDDFDYTAATESSAGSVSFKLQIKSKTGRTITYAPAAAIGLDVGSAKLYCATKEAAVAAVEKAVVTSDPDDEAKKYDNLKTVVASVDNTQESVEAAVKDALKDNALATVIKGWTVKNITVTYAPAAPDAADGSKNPGKVSITADIVLKADETVKGELKVENAPVVDWKDTFQTVAQLKAAIEAAKAIEVDADSDLPADATGAQGKISTLLTSLCKGNGLNVEAVYNDATTPAAFSSDATAKTAKYEKVLIKIKKGAEEMESFTVDFTWSVKADAQP